MFVKRNSNLLFGKLIVIILLLFGCSTKGKINSTETPEISISESEFHSVPATDKPWVYYWWLKGNVTKELITRDLEEMQKKGSEDSCSSIHVVIRTIITEETAICLFRCTLSMNL